VANFTIRPTYPQEEKPTPIKEEVEWAPELVWMGLENRKRLVPAGIEAGIVRAVVSRYNE